MNFNKTVIYQLFLRVFTPEGTLKAAEDMLEHIKELGADIVYLCPVCEADDDMDEAFWSDRQKKSGLNNPKNPYRIKDYFTIDDEYGNEDDLRSFINKAHSLGLKVLLDLVYFHCGPKAKLLEMEPEMIVREADGMPENGEWHFPRLNFESDKLREYMYSNMEYFVKEFGNDGYRIDIGDYVTLDFWVEGIKRLKKINPDIIMLNEGDKPEYVKSGFDLNYNTNWAHALTDVFPGDEPAAKIKNVWLKYHDNDNLKGLRSFETHDITNNAYDNRMEKIIGSQGAEAVLTLNFTIDGTPMLYNGNEVCDTTRHSIYSNRFYGKNFVINWRNALTESGKKRISFIKKLILMKKNIPALSEGSVNWIDTKYDDKLLVFTRATEAEKILIAVNTTKDYVNLKLDEIIPDSVLLSSNAVQNYDKELNLDIGEFGYIVLKCK